MSSTDSTVHTPAVPTNDPKTELVDPVTVTVTNYSYSFYTLLLYVPRLEVKPIRLKLYVYLSRSSFDLYTQISGPLPRVDGYL